MVLVLRPMGSRLFAVAALSLWIGGVVAACAAFGVAPDANGPEADASADALGQPCTQPLAYCASCTETFANTDGAENLALSGGWLYWTTSSGRVMRQPTNGGSLGQQTLAQGQDAPRALAADERGVFWLNTATGMILTCAPTPSGGCTPKSVATGPPASPDETAGMALDATHVYWAAFGLPDGGAGGVFGAPRDGGALLELSRDPGAQYVAVDDLNVYWLTNCTGAARRPKDGIGLEVPLPPKTCTFGSGGLVLDEKAVYVGGRELVRIPLVGATSSLPKTDLAGLAMGCTDLYWSEPQDGGTALVRLPRDSFHADGTVNAQARETLARNAGGNVMVVDRSGVYWSAGTSIMRLHPRR